MKGLYGSGSVYPSGLRILHGQVHQIVCVQSPIFRHCFGTLADAFRILDTCRDMFL